jgi:hypothetical protein
MPGQRRRIDDRSQLASSLGGLNAADLVQRDVALALQAALGVPVGLAVADEDDVGGQIVNPSPRR